MVCSAFEMLLAFLHIKFIMSNPAIMNTDGKITNSNNNFVNFVRIPILILKEFVTAHLFVFTGSIYRAL